MLQLLTGPSQATLQVINIDNDSNDGQEKLAASVGQMMNMLATDRFKLDASSEDTWTDAEKLSERKKQSI